jgi:hypothetical protein
MAAKSPTELIRELQIEVTKLTEQITGLKEEVRTANLLGLRERFVKIEERLSVVDLTSVLTRLATLEEQVSELKKAREEIGRRMTQVGLLFFGSLLTLAVQLVLLFLKK